MVTLISILACLYTTDCPKGNECLVDSSGHGYCVSALQRPDVTNLANGARGSFCTFQADCDEGLACVKRNVNDYGVCTKEASQ